MQQPKKPTETSQQQQITTEVFELLKQTSSTDKNFLETLDKNILKAYLNLLESLRDLEVEIEWGSPNPELGDAAYLSQENIINTIEKIKTLHNKGARKNET